MNELISTLTSIAAPSGAEGSLLATIQELVTPLVDEVFTDVLGNLYAISRGGEGSQTIMLTAPVDEPGLTVIDVDHEGFARIEALGHLTPASLVGSRVKVARTGDVGVIGVEAHVDAKEIGFRHLFVDLGLDDADTTRIRVGDALTLQQHDERVGTSCLVGHALESRIGCALLIQLLQTAKSRKHTLVVVFSVQEQVGSRGAQIAAYRAQPDVALTLSLTPAGDTPKAERSAVSLGKGPAIKILDRGMIVSYAMRDRIIAAAERADAPYQLEVSKTGDSPAVAIMSSRAGIPTGGIAVPSRYMGTPSQMVDVRDVANALRVLQAIVEV